MFIIRTLIITVYIYYIILTTKNANNNHNMCITGVCKDIHTKVTLKSATSNMKFPKLVDPIGIKMPNFMPYNSFVASI